MAHGVLHNPYHGIVHGVKHGALTLGNTVDRDATSLIYVPSTVAQYSSLGLATPTEIHLCQEASGDLTGEILSEVLAANNSPAYQQSVSGWSRKGVRGNAVTANQRFQGVGPDPSATSVAVLAYVGNMVPPGDGAARGIIVFGTSTSDIGISNVSAGSNVFRYRSPADIEDSVGAYGTGGHVILVVHDLVNSRSRFYTDQEKITPTFGAASSGTVYGIGGIGGGVFEAATVMYLARFEGAAAASLSTDATAKSFLEALNWTIPWS